MRVFVPDAGKALIKERTMAFCEQCGNQLNESAKFCGKCGTPVVAGQAETQQASVPGGGESPARKAYNAGLACKEAGQYDQAIAHFTEAVRLVPPNISDPYYERGGTYFLKGDFDSAINDYTKVLQINPEEDTAYNNRGLSYFNIENYEKAVADFSRAIQLKPDEDGDAAATKHSCRGDAFAYMGAVDSAIADYTKAIQFAPGNAETYGNRAMAYMQKGDMAKAQADVERGLQIDPEDETVAEAVGHLQEMGAQGGGMSVPSSCGQCGAPLEAGEAFCANCGPKVGAGGQYMQTASVCNQCGAPLEAGEAFCANCGAGVGQTVTSLNSVINNFVFINSECICVNLVSETKEEIIIELVEVLASLNIPLNRDVVLRDLFEREKKMSTGMKDGIAIPHAATNGISEFVAIVGIKKEGVDFDSLDGKRSQLFILTVYPLKKQGRHLQFLAKASQLNKNNAIRESVINALTLEKAAEVLRKSLF
jgi:mannitol/fructose-specific phosphotransferase system IIA component (Ntr-type)/Flp pilus assembly protein TadD